MATPVNYSLTFRVDTASILSSCPADPGPLGQFGCLAIGDTFIGTLAFDDSVLLKEGVVENTGTSAFNLQFGALFYSNTRSSVLRGFANTDHLTSMNPSVFVQNGELVDLLGFAYSFNGAPFINFFDEGPTGERGRFLASDLGRNTFTGTLDIAAIPEPATLLLLLPALAMIAATRRKQNPRRRAFM